MIYLVFLVKPKYLVTSIDLPETVVMMKKSRSLTSLNDERTGTLLLRYLLSKHLVLTFNHFMVFI